jgi:hypothetical protein
MWLPATARVAVLLLVQSELLQALPGIILLCHLAEPGRSTAQGTTYGESSVDGWLQVHVIGGSHRVPIGTVR